MSVKTTVTYEIVTPKTIAQGQGAVDDEGYISPAAEIQISIGNRCKQSHWRNRRIRQAGLGWFDWPSIRAAATYLINNAGGPININIDDLGFLTVSCLQDGADVEMGPNGYQEADDRTNLYMHVSCLSRGSAARLSRVLKSFFA